MTMRLAAGAVVGVLALPAAWSGRVMAEPTRPAVSLPLFVTDARGRSIPNLQAPDIEIAEGGTPQKVSSVVFRGAASRRIALFLDEYHVSPGASAERARASITTFIDRHLRADDAVVVMKPLDQASALAPAPTREALRTLIAAFDGRRGVYQPRGSFEAEYISVAPSAAERQRAQVVRAGMESLALSLREGGDARALIVVTEGFGSTEPSRMRTTTLRTIARAARLGNVPVYVIDPSADLTVASPLNEAWRSLSTETGGMLFPAGSDLDTAFSRVASDLAAHYVIEFQGAARDDGGFHGIEVKVKRRGAQVRAPSGYWAPFGPSRFPPVSSARPYASLLTPHVSGLIQPWFRMAPAASGKTRVTFSWLPRTGPKVTAERVDFAAITFEGVTVHAASLGPLRAGAAEVTTSFEVDPGPLQISMEIGGARPLGKDVRYVEVPRLDAARPFIAAVEFVRPRSLPEFRAMITDPAVMPTEAREFQRQDRLLVRVRAFAASATPDVTVLLLNRRGQTLMELPRLQPVDGAAQFDLPFARFPRGDYRLEIRATAGETTSQVSTIRVIG